MRRAVQLTLVLVLAAACSRRAPAASQVSTAAGLTPIKPVAAQTLEPQAPPVKPLPAQLPDVVARVNGDAIGKAEFEKAIKVVEQQNGAPAPPDQRDRVYRGVLDQIVDYRLLVQESKARNIAVADADIDARIGQIRGQFPTEEAFKQALAQQNLSLDQMRADARSEMMVTKLLQTQVEGKVVAAVKPEEVADFYEKNPDKFQQGERVRASHILIRFPENADPAAKQQARAKAESLLKDVKAGKDFATLAKANSQDPGSAVNGGDLGFFEHGQMVGPFDQAAFSLTPGQTSEIVETQFGYHIIKVAEKLPAGKAPLDDEMRTKIQQFLENQLRQEQAQMFVQSLRAKGKVEIYI